MRILVDYRPALHQPTGVGAYVHELAHALVRVFPDDQVTAFSSSWRHRVDRSRIHGLDIVDRRVPVRLLNFLWHRLEAPAIETLAGSELDVAHSPHPLLMPARHAARVVTIHDLHFLKHPERSRAEIRRDYPRLVQDHAARADRIVVSSRFAAGEVARLLDVPPSGSSSVPRAPRHGSLGGSPPPGVMSFSSARSSRARTFPACSTPTSASWRRGRRRPTSSWPAVRHRKRTHGSIG